MWRRAAQATEALLAAFFSAFGQVLEFKIVFDPHTGCSRGYGFVAFQHAASADVLKAMRSVDFFGRTVRAAYVSIRCMRYGGS
jgi:RNA recognition motif-containing protein